MIDKVHLPKRRKMTFAEELSGLSERALDLIKPCLLEISMEAEHQCLRNGELARSFRLPSHRR